MSLLNEMLEAALITTEHYGQSTENISDEFKQRCEVVIIDFMVKANVLLTEEELKSNPIGGDLWKAIHGTKSAFKEHYKNGNKLIELASKYETMEDELNDNIKR